MTVTRGSAHARPVTGSQTPVPAGSGPVPGGAFPSIRAGENSWPGPESLRAAALGRCFPCPGLNRSGLGS